MYRGHVYCIGLIMVKLVEGWEVAVVASEATVLIMHSPNVFFSMSWSYCHSFLYVQNKYYYNISE